MNMTNFDKSADDIIEALEQLGFTTEHILAEGRLKLLIMAILSGNTSLDIKNELEPIDEWYFQPPIEPIV